MSTFLCPQLSEKFSLAVEKDSFFSKSEHVALRKFEARERPPICKPGSGCNTNLFFGFFFDGTKNNYEQAEIGKNHSNVARLYDCFPGLSVAGVLKPDFDWKTDVGNYAHFFKTYIPGVASPFKQVGDTGAGVDAITGGGLGAKGGHRIIWALIQAINNVHRFFFKELLILPAEEFRLVQDMQNQLTAANRALLKTQEYSGTNSEQERQKKTVEMFRSLLERLHNKVKDKWPEKTTFEKMRDFVGHPGAPRKIDPAIVQTIYVSIFGFSRGSTQARAFANWFNTLCALDSSMTGRGSGSTLGGFEVKLDFMGLFDTVASVGAGNSFGNSFAGKLFDGHGFWADTEDSLRIPPGVRCVHLVAAHELRRSFPLDSIAVKKTQLPPNCDEIVIPGMHSDLGSGYAPLEQGRGTDPTGADMLARIPLVYMYRAARLAGVPLKLEFASDIAKTRFQVHLDTIKTLNAYLATCEVTAGPITGIMREQAVKQMQWRLARRVNSPAPIQKSSSFVRACTFDKNDILSAANEFEEEIKAFETWLTEKKKGTIFNRNFTAKVQDPGFGNTIPGEWEEIATWWEKYTPPNEAVMKLFDDYVHDSRAWFKIIPMNASGDSNPDNEKELREQLAKWGKPVKLTHRDPRTPEQRRLGEEFLRTDKVPVMTTVGREPWSVAGYLRYRKIYGGFDSVLLSDAGEGLDTGAGTLAQNEPATQPVENRG